MDGVNGVRRLLSRSWIDEERCERGLAALQNYRREWDEERTSQHEGAWGVPS